jgi:dTMP kinase
VFITFEGIEGSGKSVQARLLVQRLRNNNVPVVQTREPGGTPLGDHVRELVLLRGELKTTPQAEALLMCTSRAQLVSDVIRPALTRGETVVCDRFSDSTLAYQGYGRGLPIAQLEAVISFATAGLAPDMTILLELPVEDGLARKQAQPAVAWNRFESEAYEFHSRVRAGYHELARQNPSRWRCLDAQRSAEELAEDIWQIISAEL